MYIPFLRLSIQRGVSVLPCDMVLNIVRVIVCSCIIVCYLWRHAYCVLYVSFYSVCSLWFYFPHMLILGNPEECSMSTMCHCVTGLYYTMCHCVTRLYYNVPLCYRTVLQCATVLQDCTTMCHCVTGLYYTMCHCVTRLYYNVPLCYRTVLWYTRDIAMCEWGLPCEQS